MMFIDWLRRFFSQRQDERGASPFGVGRGPARLVLLRHAEKTGNKRDPNLSPAGTARAHQLVSYLPATFGTPDFLIAARTSKRSRRPVETLEPLAATYAMEIDARFDDEDVDLLVRALADDPIRRGRFGIMSWRHSDLPRLAARLGASGMFAAGWHSEDYSTIVDIDYRGGGEVTARRLTMPF